MVKLCGGQDDKVKARRRTLAMTHYDPVPEVTDSMMGFWHSCFCFSVSLGFVTALTFAVVAGAYCVPWTNQYMDFQKNYAPSTCTLLRYSQVETASCTCFKCQSDPSCHCTASYPCPVLMTQYDAVNSEGKTEKRQAQLYKTAHDKECFFSFVDGCSKHKEDNNVTIADVMSSYTMGQGPRCFYNKEEPGRAVLEAGPGLAVILQCYIWDGAVMVVCWVFAFIAAFKSGCCAMSRMHMRNSAYYFYHAPHRSHHSKNLLQVSVAAGTSGEGSITPPPPYVSDPDISKASLQSAATDGGQAYVNGATKSQPQEEHPNGKTPQDNVAFELDITEEGEPATLKTAL